MLRGSEKEDNMLTKPGCRSLTRINSFPKDGPLVTVAESPQNGPIKRVSGSLPTCCALHVLSPSILTHFPGGGVYPQSREALRVPEGGRGLGRRQEGQ